MTRNDFIHRAMLAGLGTRRPAPNTTADALVLADDVAETAPFDEVAPAVTSYNFRWEHRGELEPVPHCTCGHHWLVLEPMMHWVVLDEDGEIVGLDLCTPPCATVVAYTGADGICRRYEKKRCEAGRTCLSCDRLGFHIDAA